MDTRAEPLPKEETCQRLMSKTSKRKGLPCGDKVYVNKLGDKAIFCLKCMKLIHFAEWTVSILKEKGMTLNEATAGKVGCERRMGARSKRCGAACGKRVYSNFDGGTAIFCPGCMELKSFKSIVAPLLKERGLTLSEATAEFVEE